MKHPICFSRVLRCAVMASMIGGASAGFTGCTATTEIVELRPVEPVRRPVERPRRPVGPADFEVVNQYD